MSIPIKDRWKNMCMVCGHSGVHTQEQPCEMSIVVPKWNRVDGVMEAEVTKCCCVFGVKEER